MVDFVSERLNLGILYDDRIRAAPITLGASQPVPVNSLLGLLESILRMKGFALIDAEIPGWKRVIALSEMTSTAKLAVANDRSLRPSSPVTEVT